MVELAFFIHNEVCSVHFFDKLVNIVNSTNYSLILVFLLAVFMLPSGGSVVIPVLLLGTIVLLNGKRLEYLNKSEILFLSSFLLYFCIQLVYLIIFNGELRELDTPSRFLLVLPIFLYIRSYLKIGESFFIAIFLAATVSGLVSIYQYYFTEMYEARGGIENGSFALISAIYALTNLFFAIFDKRKVYKSLFIIGFLLGLTAVILSNIRGAWISVILSALILLFLGKIKVSNKFIVIIVLSVTMSALLFTNIGTRMSLMYSHIGQFIEGSNVDNSVGHRLEMYKSSWLIATENPFGIGENNYSKFKDKQIEDGKTSKYVAHHLHPHSEYITSFIEQGILGLISTLLVLFVPLRFFLVEYKKRKSKLSIFGSLVVLNYSIFAIFSGVFAHQVSTIFYTVIIAMIYGFMHNNKENFQ